MKFEYKNLLLSPINLLYDISPEYAIRFLFFLKTGEVLNIHDPKGYNEKLQCVKLFYKNQLITKLVDKFHVREYVGKICPEILNELYWYGFNASDIPWDSLPEKFVIKVTHGSGFNIICKDKKSLDINKVKANLNRWLNSRFLKCYGEWFYGVEKPRIIIEEFLSNDNASIPEDYKILCFNGKPAYIIVDSDRFTNHKRNVFDLQWNFMSNVTMNFPNDVPQKMPAQLNELLYYAAKLSQGFPHVRVDFYIIKERIFFGEMTFTNGAGFDKIYPHEFDLKLGSLLNHKSFM